MTRRRGAILLEILLSMALFVMTSLTLLSIISSSIDGLRRSRDRLFAADHARSAMAQIEAGIARPEALSGPIPAWGAEDADAMPDPSLIGIDPGDDVPATIAEAPAEWALEIETEPSEFDGLMLVSVRAHRIDAAGFEYDGAPSFTLRQHVRLGSSRDEAGGGGSHEGFADASFPPAEGGVR